MPGGGQSSDHNNQIPRQKKNPPIFKLNLLVCTVYVKKLFSGGTAKKIIDIDTVGFGKNYFRKYIFLESADYTLAFLQETRQSMNKNVFIKRTFSLKISNLLVMHFYTYFKSGKDIFF
jgi:hypothetical protein